jgi:hypothetical protein
MHGDSHADTENFIRDIQTLVQDMEIIRKIFVGDMKKNIWRLLGEIILFYLNFKIFSHANEDKIIGIYLILGNTLRDVSTSFCFGCIFFLTNC